MALEREDRVDGREETYGREDCDQVSRQRPGVCRLGVAGLPSMSITVNLATGQTVSFDVDPAKSGRGFFVMGIRKCGSTMLNRLCERLARASGVHWVAVSG